MAHYCSSWLCDYGYIAAARDDEIFAACAIAAQKDG